MFKVGEFVVYNNITKEYNLTEGKSYVIHDIDDMFSYSEDDYSILIIDDNNNVNYYDCSIFISLKDYRKQKLERLCLK